MEGIQQAYRIITDRSNTEPIEKEIPDLLPYKKIFMEIAKLTTGGRFVVDDRNREVVRSLFLYFLSQPGPLDITKGLWMEGPVGTGKSTLMNVFSAFMRFLHRGFKVYICSDITTDYSLNGDMDIYLRNRHGILPGPAEMCFDELGREPVPAGFYGTKLNVMQNILHIRYNYWQTKGVRTFITTNMDAVKIGDLYGMYIRDRRKEMFNIIPLLGDSRR